MMNENSLHDLLYIRAEEGLEFLNGNSISCPAGHNGPYFDQETPVRNTAHWLMVFAAAFKWSGEARYLKAVDRCATYLVSEDARPFGKTFYHRKSTKKDECNGLIGQAWTIEALVEAANVLGEKKFLQVARNVFNLHPFCSSKGLWKRVSPEGRCLGFDLTFNHQLWFCMAGALVFQALGQKEQSISIFFNRLSKNLMVASSGRIHQSANQGFLNSRLKPFFKIFFRREQQRYLKDKEIGYHAFNMYAFACLYEMFPEHSFWMSFKFKTALMYLASDEYRLGIIKSKYGFPYNPPGYEVAYVCKVFKNQPAKEILEWLLELQVDVDFNDGKQQCVLAPYDRLTSDARFYEAIRVLDRRE